MRSLVLVAALWAAVAGTPALAEKATHDYDVAAPFASFKTYAWIADPDALADFNHRRIVAAIERELATKGLARVERAYAPQLLLSYRLGVDRSARITGAHGWAGYRFAGPARIEPVLNGTLFIELSDPHTRRVVWRGMAHREIDAGAQPEKRQRNIEKTVRKILRNYPPRP